MNPQIPIIEKKIKTYETESGKLEKPFTFYSNKALALRVYPDNNPKNMEIAALQKGLVLVHNGSELIEEGAGFGVPIIKYFDRTFFSKTATVYVKEQDENSVIIEKMFLLDAISKKQVRGSNINDNLYSILHKTFEKLYLYLGKMRSFFDLIMKLRKTIGIETQFSKVSPKGRITVSYHCFSDHIKVYADFTEVDKTGCKEILILNEQGATFFRKHSTGNEILCDKKIGAWKKIVAEKAEFSDIINSITFSMEKKDGAILYCGWEQIKDRFSWAGMTYALSPETSIFNYTIRLTK